VLYVGRELLADRGSVLGVQVDLIAGAVEGEPHRLLRRAAGQIVFQGYGYFLGHRCLPGFHGMPAPYPGEGSVSVSSAADQAGLAGHGCWQAGGVEPAAEVATAGRGGRVGQRGRYGIDGGFAGLAVFGVIEAGLAGTVAWAGARSQAGRCCAGWRGRRGGGGVSGELAVLHWAR
jgi:hypothetical protein